MATFWKNHEPSPIEFMHGRLQDEFHKWRKQKTENTSVVINGIEFNKIVVAAKKATYEKYHALKLNEPVLKSELEILPIDRKKPRTFDLDHQYQLYLKRVGLIESNMHPIQKAETKRAFIGACGQMLLLLRDDLGALEENLAIKTMQDMINQVANYFMNESNKLN